MDFQIEEKNDIVIFHINQEIDFYTTPDLKPNLMKKIDEDEKKKIIIDMTNTLYIDSSGLELLIITSNKIKKINGFFAVAGIKSKSVSDIFNITKMSHFFNIYESLEEAIRVAETK